MNKDVTRKPKRLEKYNFETVRVLIMSEERDPAKVLPGTIPVDPRFPNQNQTRFCFVMFVDYHKCIRLFDESHKDCDYFKKAYQTVCPNFWIEKWHQQLENGNFPYTLPEKKKDKDE